MFAKNHKFRAISGSPIIASSCDLTAEDLKFMDTNIYLVKNPVFIIKSHKSHISKYGETVKNCELYYMIFYLMCKGGRRVFYKILIISLTCR